MPLLAVQNTLPCFIIIYMYVTVAKENEVTAAQTTVKQAEMRFDFVFRLLLALDVHIIMCKVSLKFMCMCKFRLQSLRTQLKGQEKIFKSGSKSYLGDKAAHETVRKEISRLESSLTSLNYHEGQLEDLVSNQ